ncbi:MAG: DUF4292 domain-containing protein [Sphingobacteriia bacterium]|nr:DUF4292 domain-containing protein [Sphingobacteriia bacterium]
MGYYSILVRFSKPMFRMNRFFEILFWIYLIGFSMYGCKTRHKAESNRPIKEKEKEKTNNHSAAHPSFILWDNIQEAAFPLDTIALKGEAVYENRKESLSFSYRIHMIRNQLIWVSVSKLGVEGVRILMLPDSIQILNRLQKNYQVSDYKYLSELTGMELTLSSLQQLLVGNLSIAKERLVVDNRHIVRLILDGIRDSTEIQYEIDTVNFRINKMETKNARRNLKSDVKFNNFISTPNSYWFPMQFNLTVFQPDRHAIIFKHNRIEIHPISFPLNFSVPLDYARIETP